MASNSATPVILLVVGILLGQFLLFWVPFLIYLRRKSARMTSELTAEITARGERAVRGPESALYSGASDGYSRVKGNGVVVLTDKRLVFRKLIGQPLEIALDQVAGVREDKWFLSAYRGGRLHTIVKLRNGEEVGFMVRDPAGWMRELQAVAGRDGVSTEPLTLR